MSDPRYHTRRWKERRARHLECEPICRMCKEQGLINDGTLRPDGTAQTVPLLRSLVADHVIPHRGGPTFWTGELQTLCGEHHNRTKQRIEARGYSNRPDADGWPVDPNHPANRT